MIKKKSYNDNSTSCVPVLQFMLSITLLFQVPQTIPVRYVFGFVREIITCTCRTHQFAFTSSCAVCRPIRLLLFYSVIFQSCKFQSCKFSYPPKMLCVFVGRYGFCWLLIEKGHRAYTPLKQHHIVGKSYNNAQKYVLLFHC